MNTVEQKIETIMRLYHRSGNTLDSGKDIESAAEQRIFGSCRMLHSEVGKILCKQRDELQRSKVATYRPASFVNRRYLSGAASQPLQNAGMILVYGGGPQETSIRNG